MYGCRSRANRGLKSGAVCLLLMWGLDVQLTLMSEWNRVGFGLEAAWAKKQNMPKSQKEVNKIMETCAKASLCCLKRFVTVGFQNSSA